MTARPRVPRCFRANPCQTVIQSGAGFGIVEQNFDYDLLSPAALMEKADGQMVTLLRTNPAPAR